MIRNATDLRFVREQQQLVRDALKSIEEEVRPVNEARFELIAEAYRDQIAAIQAEIDEYLGKTSPAKKRRSG
jgi:t-SNARE complex subunit (syntaxin)